jgi:gamma-glutamylcyclotransferase (GGCT)/AIG2-like uncharacterized protein YtfP
MLDRLFCYGTLCVPEIMREIAGREIPAEPAVLDDYACYIVRYQYYPAAVPMAGASISGLLYSGFTPHELLLLDRYEGTEYRRARVSVTTEQGRQAQAWVYIIRPQYEARLSDRKFNLEEFLKTEAQEYLRGVPFRN